MYILLIISFILGFVSAFCVNELFNFNNKNNEYEFLYSNNFSDSIYIEHLKKKIESMTDSELKYQLNEFESIMVNDDNLYFFLHDENIKNIKYQILLLNEKNKRDKRDKNIKINV